MNGHSMVSDMNLESNYVLENINVNNKKKKL